MLFRLQIVFFIVEGQSIVNECSNEMIHIDSIQNDGTRYIVSIICAYGWFSRVCMYIGNFNLTLI